MPATTPGQALETIGSALYGEFWQARLADSVRSPAGEPVSKSTVSRWTRDLRPIPAWVWPDLDRLLADRRNRLRQAHTAELDALYRLTIVSAVQAATHHLREAPS